MQIPVSVFTGFLGAGKTTIIINLIKQMPASYKLVMLKNEFGNVEVDSKIMEGSNIKVTEMLNGCLCCILVGKLGNALDEILKNYTPDHIIIETSGSAYPAPIAWEINKMKDKLKLDGIITVIDAKNFEGYRDISYTAKLQAQYTDLILINKHEQVAPEVLDKVLDDVYDLNSTTPKVKTDKGYVSANIVFGLNSNLVDIKQVSKVDVHHHDKEVDIMELITDKDIDKEKFMNIIKSLPKWDFYRIKGVLRSNGKCILLNYAFGDLEIIEPSKEYDKTQITFMGKNFNFHYPALLKDLELTDKDLILLNEHH